MPDFTTESHQECTEWRRKNIDVPSESDPDKTYTVTADFSERRMRNNEFYCSCPAYKYQKMGKTKKMCKHIKKVKDQFCGWHSMWGKSQTEEEKKNNICPECGGKTETVQVAV